MIQARRLQYDGRKGTTSEKMDPGRLCLAPALTNSDLAFTGRLA